MLAYLDANSGSLIVSAIAAGAAGIAVVMKTGWRRITSVFSSDKRAASAAEKAEREQSEHTPDATPTA